MKLIRSCQDEKKQAFLVLFFSLLYLQGCALTSFLCFSIGHFYNRKLMHPEPFGEFPTHPIPQIFDCAENTVRQRQPPLASEWETHSLQGVMCYLSQLPRMLLAPLACAACRHAPGLQTRNRTGAALVETGTTLLQLMDALG